MLTTFIDIDIDKRKFEVPVRDARTHLKTFLQFKKNALRTEQLTDRRTDRRTDPLVKMRGRI